MINIPFFRLA